MEEQIQLKISRYTFVFSDNSRHYLYNAMSNALMEVDEELASFMRHSKVSDVYKIETLDAALVETLKKNGYITKNDEDDFLLYKSIITAQRNMKNILILTIAPTMDCCFSCNYCFEKAKHPSYMSEDVMKGISKFLGKFENIKKIQLTWFGGEPLMAVPEMERFYRKLRRRFKGIIYDSNIITTGFHLNEENIRALQRMKVSNMQITLDGLRETHNSIKFTEGCDDAFSVVIENIGLLTSLAPEIHVVIRVNLTKSNAHEYHELQHFIMSRFIGKNIAIAPAFVLDRSNCGKISDPNIFSAKEYPDYILGLAKSGIDSPQVRYPDKYFTECAIRNPQSLAFDPEGNVYKCWEHIGDEQYSIGRINKKGAIENVNVTLLNRQLYGADPLDDPRCRRCAYLPICQGGCPIHRIENEFQQGENDCCTYYKGHMEEFILHHIRMKEFEKKAHQQKMQK